MSEKPKKPKLDVKGRMSDLRRASAHFQKLRSRRTVVLNEVVERTRPKMVDRLFAGASEFLCEKLGLEVGSSASRKEILAQAVRRKIGHDLVRVSRTKYLQFLDLANAFAAVIDEASDEEKALLIGTLCADAGIKPNRRTTPISVALRALIDYGKDASVRRFVSRDAKAIEYLRAQGVPVGGFVEYQKKHGGGVDEYSRALPKQDVPKDICPATPAPAVVGLATDFSEEDLIQGGNEFVAGGSGGAYETLSRMISGLEPAFELARQIPEGKSAILLVTNNDGQLTAVAAPVRQRVTKPIVDSPLWEELTSLAEARR